MYKFVITIGLIIFVIFPFSLISQQTPRDNCLSSYFSQKPEAYKFMPGSSPGW